ncbi:hypothetical protein P607_05015 [Comamonas thiooxydans]|uniref:hypothetical protein n=2 Tax=Comamonas thiooxydans TaxID=363952 RepID=UPI00050F513B|nr:hypothetical protein [Comamonas thiooxydans]KGH25697.1 hypothetical protein P607_05015 [Comamonas thiooxydans]
MKPSHKPTNIVARSSATARAVLGLIASVVAGAAHATDPSNTKAAASSFSQGCTRLAGGDLVLVLTPTCLEQLATDTGRQAFQGVVQSEVQSYELRRAAQAAGSARANLARLSQLATMDGDPAARRAANYATRQATPMGGGQGAASTSPRP